MVVLLERIVCNCRDECVKAFPAGNCSKCQQQLKSEGCLCIKAYDGPLNLRICREGQLCRAITWLLDIQFSFGKNMVKGKDPCVQENFAIFAKFSKISCTRIFGVLQYLATCYSSRLQDTNRLSYANFYFPPEIDQFSKWKALSNGLCGTLSDIGVMANHLNITCMKKMKICMIKHTSTYCWDRYF